jgi:DNA topoisomerase IB
MTAIRAAAEMLGNTAAVCRKFYVHECLVGAYSSGKLHKAFRAAAGQRTRRLSLCERATLVLLRPAASRR